MVNKSMKTSFFKYAPLALLPLLFVYTWTTRIQRQARVSSPVSYQVLEDAMATKLSIGVDSSVGEQQLIATLTKAADDHQYDAARDLLLSSYFSVEAYLVDNRKRSTEPAGTIKRYVPPKNGAEHRDWLDWLPDLYGKEDKFSVTLEKAKQSLH